MTARRSLTPLALALALAFPAFAPADDEKKPAAPPSAERIEMWVQRFFSGHDCPLHSEIKLNGKSLGIFHSNTQRDLTGQLVLGTNTISFTTTPQEPANDENWLTITIGSVTTNPKTKKTTMKPVLIHYNNGIDWKFDKETGKYTHPFGPNPKTPERKSVTHTYTFEYVGSAAETAESKEGAYVLQGKPFFTSTNPSVLATVSVNGKPVGSFLGSERSIDITRLLKAGENEVRLMTNATANQLAENDVTFEILGPLTYNVPKERFVGKRVIEFKALEGWKRDKDSGVLHVKGSPGKFTHERVIRFTLDEAPK